VFTMDVKHVTDQFGQRADALHSDARAAESVLESIRSVIEPDRP